MFQTGKQTTKAMRNIVKKTDWSLRMIAERLEVSHQTACKLYNGHTKNPKQETMDRVEALEIEAEAL